MHPRRRRKKIKPLKSYAKKANRPKTGLPAQTTDVQKAARKGGLFKLPAKRAYRFLPGEKKPAKWHANGRFRVVGY